MVCYRLHNLDFIVVFASSSSDFLPSFAHNFVSGSFYFNESQDAIVLQICH